MRNIILISIFLIGSLFASPQADIVAKKVSMDLSRISYKSHIWNSVEFSNITFYPQTTVRLNDKTANEKLAHTGAKVASIGAIYNQKHIAFMIKWPDESMNILKGYESDIYADGFAVEFVVGDINVSSLPHVAMGSKGRPVIVHLQKAVRDFYEPNGRGNVRYQLDDQNVNLFARELKQFDKKVRKIASNDYEKSFISEGFGSMSEIKDDSSNSYARVAYRHKMWLGTLSRKLKDEYVNLDRDSIAVAFALFDGEKNHRGANKIITSWLSVKLREGKGVDELIDTIDIKADGNVSIGRKLALKHGCKECHQLQADDKANPKAPNLQNIGGYQTASYLKESLVSPSAVIVAGYAKKTQMKNYSYLSEDELNDLISYLQTLKAEVRE